LNILNTAEGYVSGSQLEVVYTGPSTAQWAWNYVPTGTYAVEDSTYGHIEGSLTYLDGYSILPVISLYINGYFHSGLGLPSGPGTFSFNFDFLIGTSKGGAFTSAGILSNEIFGSHFDLKVTKFEIINLVIP